MLIHSFTAFIGGAADKYSFAPGDIPINYEGNTLGPTYIVGDYAKLMKVEIEKDFKNAFNEYYGYEEAFTGAIRNRKNKTNAFEDIKKIVEENPNTQVNIIGHSLGGWNAAGLAQELGQKKICKVNLLITIDPVGTNLSWSAVTGVAAASIYFKTPKPNPNYWISITCDPETFSQDDSIAVSGGKWKTEPRARANIYHKTKFSHADFKYMMKEKIWENRSAEDLLLLQLGKIK